MYNSPFKDLKNEDVLTFGEKVSGFIMITVLQATVIFSVGGIIGIIVGNPLKLGILISLVPAMVSGLFIASSTTRGVSRLKVRLTVPIIVVFAVIHLLIQLFVRI